MDFENYLIKHIAAHPSSLPQDIVKLCYQAANGAEHLLCDTGAARAYFLKEYVETDARDIPLYEDISENVCRVHLAAWKNMGLFPEWLFSAFAASSSVGRESGRPLSEYIDTVERVLTKIHAPFTVDEWKAYISEYKRLGMPAVHHSDVYREAEKPSYRIVDSRYMRIIPILEAVIKLPPKNGAYVIAIDGRAASGKTTVAEQLKTVLGAEIIHMDDFFLPIDLRTEERLKTAGGNVHYERVSEEVLPFISKEDAFSYRRFDCGKMDLDGVCAVKRSKIRVVEGSYSHHPYFGDYADIKVFSDIEYEEQLRRIKSRNGDEKLEIFKKRWIPLEERYFSAYGIREKADLII